MSVVDFVSTLIVFVQAPMDVMCLIDFCMSEFADVVCHFELHPW